MGIRDLAPSLWHKGEEGNHKPFMPIETLREEMDQLFDSFFPKSGMPSHWHKSNQGITDVGLADVSETDKEIEVAIDLPGIDKKDIDITYADNHLTVEGKREDKREEKGKDFHRLERSFGSFRRSFYIPSEIEEDKVEAKFSKGVLKISMPKSPEAQKAQKKIEIKAS